MARPRIEGLAIVSADGMIADAAGVQPAALKPEADQQFFLASLERADVLVHGRHSGEGGAQAERRRRLILTRSVGATAPVPGHESWLYWNPAGVDLDAALAALGPPCDLVMVIGGSEVFGLFLEIGYDAFHLSRAGRVRLPGGRPVFPGIPPETPETLLARSGLKPGPERVLDASLALVLTTWTR